MHFEQVISRLGSKSHRSKKLWYSFFVVRFVVIRGEVRTWDTSKTDPKMVYSPVPNNSSPSYTLINFWMFCRTSPPRSPFLLRAPRLLIIQILFWRYFRDCQNGLFFLQNCEQLSLNSFNHLSVLIPSWALSFFLKRHYKHHKSKRGGLTLDLYSLECLNHSNVRFAMSHANSIDFNIGSQYNVKWNFLV